ncbi:MAG TPA: serine/threonine-protein kinase [Gemmatimonadaceae bacterium]|nr:serine/threonine-protein kinase [Gemmatimonadaceae bacterium]
MSPSNPSVDAELVAFQSAVSGRYFVEREIGRGGMGVVYLAREVQLDRPVAIKLLPPALAVRPELRERFLREARTAAKLSHPHIVPIFQVDEVGGFVFFVMAYVEGETLGARVRARGPLPPHDVARIIREVAWALAYSHARGIVHRDIKPDNILLDRESGRALVTDFGIAHVAASSSLTEVGQVMGTAHFMSPEQASAEPLDGRSDLYSLGTVAYLALTGKLPFDAPTVQGVLAQHLTQPPPPIASARASVPARLARAVERCLEKDPALRFQSGEALADGVAEAVEARQQIPAPVRVWLAKGDALKPLYVILGFIGFMMAISLEPEAIFFLGGPLLFHAIFRLYQTRRALAEGYGLDDLRAALRHHAEQRREEIAFDLDRDPPLPAKLLRGATYLAYAGFVALAIAMRFFDDRIPESWGFTRPIVALTSLAGLAVAGGVLGLVYPGRRITSAASAADLRARLWGTRAAEWFTRVAAFRLPRRAAAATARPTEAVIGMAAADLFASLPREAKRRLRELPEVVRRLELDAQEMRRRVAELDDRLAGLAADEGASRSQTLDTFHAPGADALAGQRQSVADDLRGAREAAGGRLAATLAALEAIRLDLLRLQAGAGSVESLTVLLESARRVGEQIDGAVTRRDEALAARSPA